MEYTEFLQCHKTLNDNDKNKQWNGSLYLPPCTCLTSSKCAHSCLESTFDFSSFSDTQVPNLVNLCKYIDPNCDSYTQKILILCQKYSLLSLKDSLQSLYTTRHKVQTIKQSSEYRIKKNTTRLFVSPFSPFWFQFYI